MLLKLSDYLAQNEVIWRELEKSGINTGAPFGVEFRLHATKQAASDQILPALQAHGMKVEVQQTKVLMFLKSWKITATEKAQWTLETLKQRTKEVYDEAERAGVEFTGMGILLPDPPTQN